MISSSALVTQIAQSGAARVRQGEIPVLKNPKQLDSFQAQQNLDYFEEGFKELQARDNADGGVSIHIFTAGPDQNPTPGKIEIGGLKAEIEGNAQNGTRFSVEERGDVEKLKSYRFDDSKVVVYEATIKPGNEMNSSVLILDRENPGQSLMGAASSDWLLGL